MKVSRLKSLSAYRQQIAGLVEKVYPTFAAVNKRCLIRDFFVHSLSTECQKKWWNVNTTQIDDALNAALPFESMYSSSKICTKMQNKEENGKQYNTNYKCFVCGKAGYIAKNCYQKNKCREAQFGKFKPSVIQCTLSGSYYVTLQLGGSVEQLLVDTGAAVSVVPDCRFKPNVMQKIDLKLGDESQINSDGMTNLSVKTVDGIDLFSHNFHVAKVKKLYLGMDLLKKLDAVIHVNEEHIACRNGLKIP